MNSDPAIGLVFVDTNVLVYAHDASETKKQPIARTLVEELWRNKSGTLSTQVLQEFYVVVTRKFDPPLTRKTAREIVSAYAEWNLVHIDRTLIINASLLEERHQLSFWDALIVEAAQRAGAQRLLTEDLPSGRKIGGIKLENPFTAMG